MKGKVINLNTTFLDIPEAASFMKVRPGTLYVWLRKKRMQLPVRRHGRRVVFLRDDLLEWSNLRNKRTLGQLDNSNRDI